MREVVTASRARGLCTIIVLGFVTPVELTHWRNPSPQNTTSGIRAVVKSVLDHCAGTCKLSKTLETTPPVSRANRTMQVMDELECDLITIS